MIAKILNKILANGIQQHWNPAALDSEEVSLWPAEIHSRDAGALQYRKQWMLSHWQNKEPKPFQHLHRHRVSICLEESLVFL